MYLFYPTSSQPVVLPLVEEPRHIHVLCRSFRGIPDALIRDREEPLQAPQRAPRRVQHDGLHFLVCRVIHAGRLDDAQCVGGCGYDGHGRDVRLITASDDPRAKVMATMRVSFGSRGRARVVLRPQCLESKCLLILSVFMFSNHLAS